MPPGHDRTATLINSAIVVACLRSAQDQASVHSSMEWRRGSWAPITKELLTSDGFWGREKVLFCCLRVSPLACQPQFMDGPTAGHI